MLGKFSRKIVGLAISKNIISSQYDEIYIYKIEKKLGSLINLILFITISYFLNLLFTSVIYLFSHSIIRRHTGGYHADTKFKCFAMYMIYSLVGISVANLITKSAYNYIITMMCVLSLCIIYVFAPVGCENKQIKATHFAEMREKALLFASFLFLTSNLLYFRGLIVEGNIIIVACFFQTLTLLPFINKKDYIYKKERINND